MVSIVRDSLLYVLPDSLLSSSQLCKEGPHVPHSPNNKKLNRCEIDIETTSMVTMELAANPNKHCRCELKLSHSTVAGGTPVVLFLAVV